MYLYDFLMYKILNKKYFGEIILSYVSVVLLKKRIY